MSEASGFALAFAGLLVFGLFFWLAHHVHPFAPLPVLAVLIVGLLVTSE